MHKHRSPSGQGTRLQSANTRVRIPPGARLEGEVCAVQTPVPKIGWRESVRVRLLRLPHFRGMTDALLAEMNDAKVAGENLDGAKGHGAERAPGWQGGS